MQLAGRVPDPWTRSTRPNQAIVCLLRLAPKQKQGFASLWTGRVQLEQRAALYCRVSTADQSCARQERDLTALADRAGYEVVPRSTVDWDTSQADDFRRRGEPW